MLFTLKQLMQQYFILQEETEEVLENIAVHKTFDKREKIINEGETETQLHFIRSGIARLYYFKKGEITIDIASEGEVICSLSSYLTGKPSRYSVETIEKTSTYSFLKTDIERLSIVHLDIKILMEKIIASMLARLENKDIDYSTHKSAARLKSWINDNGDLFYRIPQNYLASYFKMNIATLSRLKKSLLKGQKRQ